MNRSFLPIIFILTAIALFMFYTDPTYQANKALQAKASAYDDALTKSQELRKLRDQLISRRNTFKEEDLQKLKKILPDNVDNIRLIIDINAIAARHNLSLKNVQLGTISDSATAQSPLAAGSSGDLIGSITLGFTVNASYDQFLLFIQDLEHSLRLIDVEDIKFSVISSDKNDYALKVRTYWLR